MNTRTSTRTVTCRHPFFLSGFDVVQPGGTYKVTTEEEQLVAVSLPVYRRVSTQIELGPRGGHSSITEVVPIDPLELDAALARDAATN